MTTSMTASGAAGREFGQQRLAQLGAALAAVLEQEQDQRLEAVQISPVDDRPAAPLRTDQTGAGQNPEVRRHGVSRHGEGIRDLAGGEALGFVPHQEAEGLKPRGLSQGSEGEDGGF
ncbi:hypothetical protein D3C75_918010 [compost metagenome]